MAKKLTNNIGLKILAVLTAAVLWLVATNINDPVSRMTYSVPVSIENLSKLTDNNKYVEVLEGTDSLRVTVRAARSVLAEISDKNIVAVADIDKMTDGNYIPIELSCTKGSIDVEDMKADKEYVHVSVENVKRRQLPISVDVVGTPQEGYMLGGTSTAQNAVMLSGPESIVNRISAVSVEIDVEQATSDVNISLPIHLYDSSDVEITDKRIDMSIADVSTTASVWLIKSVPIEFSYTGQPADGYYVDGSLKSSINFVTIAGKSSVLKNIQKIDVSDALDITGATRSIEELVDIKKALPEGVVFAEADAPTKASVSLSIAQRVEEEENEIEEEE